jgi:hypothetical protein
MDLQIIKTFFNFGKLFALTPPSPDSTSSTLCQKLFVLLMFSACTVGTLVAFLLQRAAVRATGTDKSTTLVGHRYESLLPKFLHSDSRDAVQAEPVVPTGGEFEEARVEKYQQSSVLVCCRSPLILFAFGYHELRLRHFFRIQLYQTLPLGVLPVLLTVLLYAFQLYSTQTVGGEVQVPKNPVEAENHDGEDAIYHEP